MPTNTREIIGTAQTFENNTPATGKSKLKLIGMIRAHNEEKLEGEVETGVTPEEYLQDQIALLTDLIPPPLVSLEKDQAEIEKSEKELKDLEKNSMS